MVQSRFDIALISEALIISRLEGSVSTSEREDKLGSQRRLTRNANDDTSPPTRSRWHEIDRSHDSIETRALRISDRTR